MAKFTELLDFLGVDCCSLMERLLANSDSYSSFQGGSVWGLLINQFMHSFHTFFFVVEHLLMPGTVFWAAVTSELSCRRTEGTMECVAVGWRGVSLRNGG